MKVDKCLRLHYEKKKLLQFNNAKEVKYSSENNSVELSHQNVMCHPRIKSL